MNCQLDVEHFQLRLACIYTDSRPRQYGSGWLSHDWAVPKQLTATSVKSLAKYAISRAFDSVWEVARQLPPHLLLSLIYRVVVLQFATRIIPMIRKASMGYDNGDAVPNFWDGRSLGEEPTVSYYERSELITEYALDDYSALVPPRNPHSGVHASTL